MDIVERYKNQLQGSTMTKRERSKKINAIAEEAQFAHQTCNYTESLDKFSHLVALNETDPKYSSPNDSHATYVANVGAALHHLEEWEEAKVFYDKAVEEFTQMPTGWITWLSYGDVTAKRIEHVQQRLAQLDKKEKPDPASYQDGSGKERRWRAEEMDGSKPTWAWTSPRSWFGYGPYARTAVTDPAPNTVDI